ncbi:MAG: hypothetical protein A2Z93_14890 [Curvibacter sp. GWA2_64_110]|nr:MAG: hypothetical protein A2Z93_14890 [Curvibacter sp. GWA2_64_110]
MSEEYALYFGTQDYIRGVLVEVTGIVIEVVVLSITIPIILHVIRRVRTRPIRVAADFYLFQVFHKIARIFLDMATVSDIRPILEKERRENRQLLIVSHPLYGNLENIIFVLEKILTEKNLFCSEVRKRSSKEFKQYRLAAERCIDEIDRLAAMTVEVPGLQSEIFSMRMLAYPLRDQMEKMIETLQESEDCSIRQDFVVADIHALAKQITERIGAIFKERRKLIDSMRNLWVFRMLFAAPIVFIRRLIVLPYCRIAGKPFRDYIFQSPWPDMLEKWRQEKEITKEQAAETLELAVNEYRDIEMGYREPTLDELKKMMPFIQDQIFRVDERKEEPRE